MADGRVVFEVVGDDKHINQTIKNVTSNIKNESKKWDSAASQAADGASGSWVSAVAKIAGALSAAGVVSILTNWGKAAIQSASDLAEVQNVVDVTFGEGTGKIDNWAKSAGRAFGLTETQAKRYTSTLGAMMKSQGIADSEIVKMSTDLTGLAADMASFYNLDHDTAFQKIRAGISGETEPLKQLGINMSAANLEAFRLEQGLTKSYNAMSQGEQTALRYQYIMKATADAQGDFARTSDGYANSVRRVETAMETIKTKGGELLMTVVEPLTVGLAKMLETMTTSPSITVLDDIAAIDAKTGEKISRIEKTADDARILSQELASLGDKSKLTADRQAYWMEVTNRLIQTLPGLSDIINQQTGEITGGTTAINDYIKAWEDGNKKLSMLGALQEKKDAINKRFADVPGLELDMMVEQRRARQRLDELKAVYSKYGVSVGFDAKGKVNRDYSNVYGLTKEAKKELTEAADALDSQYEKAKEVTSEYKRQKGALDEAVAALQEYEDIVNDMPGDVKTAAEAVEDLGNSQKKFSTEAVDAARTAIKAVADYAAAVRTATEQAIDGVVSGFNTLSRPTTEMEEKRSKLIEQQNALNRSTKDGEKRYQELQKQIDDLNKSMEEYSPDGMKRALQSQLAFMEEYISNMDKARSMGLSDDLLASLSDGSVQSAEYLAQLVANPEQAAEIDALYAEVKKRKDDLTDTLTDQKLSVDDVYNSLVENAKKAIGDLNLKDEAKTALSDTIQGIADGIEDKEDDVRKAVDDIIYQLDRLNGYGINVSLGSFGSINFNSPLLDGEHETGLDYVPFDGYLAGLHEGEGILTAEENRIWQRFKNGSQPQSMDYDALGATMRDNIHPGGNVYLDGRTVGRVISAQQGNDYRAMQRSGFQA